MSFEGTVINGVIVLDKDDKLAEGTRVQVTVRENVKPASEKKALEARTAKELLTQFAGCMTGLPSDLARNHDHYLHGMPKK